MRDSDQSLNLDLDQNVVCGQARLDRRARGRLLVSSCRHDHVCPGNSTFTMDRFAPEASVTHRIGGTMPRSRIMLVAYEDFILIAWTASLKKRSTLSL